MLAKRRAQYRSRLLVPRDVTVRSLVGWYKLEHPMLKKHRQSGTKLKLSRWLVTEGYSQLGAEQLTKVIKEYSVDVKILDSFNDIYRMSTSPHFTACTQPNGCGNYVPNLICQDVYSGIVYAPDKAGHFLGRAIFRLIGGEVKIFRCYGTLKFEQLRDLFASLKLAVNPVMDDTVVFYSNLQHRKIAEHLLA